MTTTEFQVLILAEALFPNTVLMPGADGIYLHQPDWRYMIAAGNRCRVFHDAASPARWRATCQVLDGAHAGVRFDSAEAKFLGSDQRG